MKGSNLKSIVSLKERLSFSDWVWWPQKIGEHAYENESITDKTRFRYVAKTISYNISSEETTYAIMKHSSPIIHSGLFSINILVSSYNVVKISSASCYLVSVTLKLYLTNDYLYNFLFYNILANPKSLSKPVIGSDVTCNSA